MAKEKSARARGKDPKKKETEEIQGNGHPCQHPGQHTGQQADRQTGHRTGRPARATGLTRRVVFHRLAGLLAIDEGLLAEGLRSGARSNDGPQHRKHEGPAPWRGVGPSSTDRPGRGGRDRDPGGAVPDPVGTVVLTGPPGAPARTDSGGATGRRRRSSCRRPRDCRSVPRPRRRCVGPSAGAGPRPSGTRRPRPRPGSAAGR